jgi:hypothetical protein
MVGPIGNERTRGCKFRANRRQGFAKIISSHLLTPDWLCIRYELQQRRRFMQSNETYVGHWITALTRLGYDVAQVSGYTSRGDWNANHPMVHFNYLFRDDKLPDVVLTYYTCNASESTRTIYATVFYGKAANRRCGWDVVGTREVTFSILDDLRHKLGGGD